MINVNLYIISVIFASAICKDTHTYLRDTYLKKIVKNTNFVFTIYFIKIFTSFTCYNN